MGLVALAARRPAAFILVEPRAAEPMLPLHMFKIGNFTYSM